MHKILILVFFVLNINSMTIDNLDDIRADWDIFSDRVMGGISEVYFYEMEEGDESFYRLEGNVSTANNGGFIQSVAKIKDINEEYKGIRITVRGSEDNIMFGLELQHVGFHGTDILLALLQAKIGQLSKFHLVIFKSLIFI